MTTTPFPLLVYRTRDGVPSVDGLVAGFFSRGDALTFVKAIHFPGDYIICDAAQTATTMAESPFHFKLFDTNGMTHQQVRNVETI